MSSGEGAALRQQSVVVAYADPADVAARIAYGEVAGARAVIFANHAPGRFRRQALPAARAALWGLYGTEFNGGWREWTTPLLEAEPIESEFRAGGGLSVLNGPARLALAADARFFLAERLLEFGSGLAGQYLTPAELDAPSWAQHKFNSIRQIEVDKCQLASCRGFDSFEEAGLLAVEADQGLPAACRGRGRGRLRLRTRRRSTSRGAARRGPACLP